MGALKTAGSGICLSRTLLGSSTEKTEINGTEVMLKKENYLNLGKQKIYFFGFYRHMLINNKNIVEKNRGNYLSRLVDFSNFVLLCERCL